MWKSILDFVFSRKAPAVVLGLKNLRKIVTGIRARGATPQPDVMTAIVETAIILGHTVTAVEEGKAEITQQREEAGESREYIPVVRQNAEDTIAALENRIEAVKNSADVEVRRLETTATNLSGKADETEELLQLIQPKS